MSLRTLFLFVVVLSDTSSLGFSIVASRQCRQWQPRSTTHLSTTSSSSQAPPSLDYKREAVKIFGRLAEKYIMLDASAGKCCYSGCTDCEFRLPGGGYRMADQSSARPKWIPNYSVREANGKRHETKWSLALFPANDNSNEIATKVSMSQFVERIRDMEYAPPLGGPSVSASDAGIDNAEAVKALFVLLAGSEETLISSKKFSKRLKALAGGDEGLTWAAFQSALEAQLLYN